MRCIIAEKPSVALDIARTLGTPGKYEGYVTVSVDCITWAYGHLATLADPEQYDPRWKRWDWATNAVTRTLSTERRHAFTRPPCAVWRFR
jgi:DNA topoisomerase-3